MKVVIFNLLFVVIFNQVFGQLSPTMNDGSASTSEKTLIVPEGKGSPVSIDGIFSKVEWDDALKVAISESYDIYLKVGSGNLFIGLKAAKPVGMLLSEIYITSNDREFHNLHSSMALGEGLIPFPSDQSQVKFSVNNNKNWETNCCQEDEDKYEKWVAEGQPREKYDEIFKKKDGKEYKINLDKLPGVRLRMMVGLRDAQGEIQFPGDGSFKSCAGWVELVLSKGQDQPADWPKLAGPYLGQKPPGNVPEVFAPGIVSTAEHEYGISFSGDWKEIYLKRIINGKGKNLVFSQGDNKWQGPEEVRFAAEGNFGQLFVMPDGNHLLANQIISAADGNLQSTIVKFSRKNGRWGNPVTIGPGMRATSAESGSIFVTHVLDSKRSLGAIARYKRVGEKYEDIEVLGEEINHKGSSSAHPFIAPDESYLIFDSQREGDEGAGLYISFSLGGNSWSKPLNLSKILNTGENAHDWYATVSPDGKYLFFSSGERGQSDIYWVSAEIIEELRPKERR